MSDPCRASCCAVFGLPRKHEYILEHFLTITDGPFLADMLIPLSDDQAREIAEAEGLPAPFLKAAGREGQWYTCRHWDRQTRLCTVYEQRPTLCRDYPNGPTYRADQACDHGCSYQVPA